jgi:hypothetical protein
MPELEAATPSSSSSSRPPTPPPMAAPRVALSLLPLLAAALAGGVTSWAGLEVSGATVKVASMAAGLAKPMAAATPGELAKADAMARALALTALSRLWAPPPMTGEEAAAEASTPKLTLMAEPARALPGLLPLLLSLLCCTLMAPK